MTAKIRKRIALLTSQPESAYQSQFLEGFLQQAFELDYDVVVFATFLKTGYSYSFQHGELNIFSLCEPNDFDAVIIVPDMLGLGGVCKKLISQLKQSYKKPVIVMDREIEDYPFTVANDADGIYTVVEHIITKHKCKDIAFISGPKNHLHGEIRLQGFRDAMQKNGLEVREDRIFYGDFWYDEGERIVDDLVSKGDVPEAFCCASDIMAIGVANALRRNGIKIPKEVIVTGFDSEGDSIRSYHSVTSIPRHNQALGRETLLKAHAEINGQPYTLKLPKYSPKDIIYKSCGCYDRNHKIKRENNVERILTAYDLQGFESGYNFMLEDMACQENITDALWTLSWYTQFMGEFENFYLCLCEDWCDVANYSEAMARTDGYPEEMILALVQKNGEGRVDMDRRFKSLEILPDLNEPREKPAVFYCTPTHYNEKNIGYTVLSYVNKPATYSMTYTRWIRYMNVALESLHRNLVTQHMYEVMKQSALMDELTGIYNRNGLYNIAPGIIQSAVENKTQLLVITADMNCMKYINDNYGHGEGDFALQKATEAIRLSTKELGGSLFRTGGDEFVYMNEGEFSFDQIGNLICNIRDNYTKLLEQANKPYPAQIALGYSCSTMQGFDTMEKLLAPSDNMMFADKKKIKEETGYKFARV